MLSSIKFPTIMITLLLFSLPLLSYLSYLHKFTAQSATVADTGHGTGVVTCPEGSQHAGIVAFDATSTASAGTGDWTISTHGPSGDVVKSGIIIAVNISPSGDFILTGRESSDGICGSLSSTSVSVQIIGQCASEGILATVTFSASNGERGDFLSSPICT